MINYTKKEIGQIIMRHREKLGLTQAEYAKRIGKSKPTVSLYENGKRMPPLDIFFEALDATDNIQLCKQECPTCKGVGHFTSVIN